MKPTNLAKLITPRPPLFCPHKPTVKQATFLLLDDREILFGGAAGGGKSDALLMAALQFVDVPDYAALLLRRTYPDLQLPGAILERSHDWLTESPATWSQINRTWTFPSGATITFGFCARPADKFRYQSSEFQYIAFDELTQFGLEEYRYLFSRLRRPRNMQVPLRMRAASNPGGYGHGWVKDRFHDNPEQRIFIPAKIEDNPFLDEEEYRKSLETLDPTTQAQLMDGNWMIHDDGILPHETIVDCEDETLSHFDILFGTRMERRELYLGIDIGRTRSLSVIWTWERIGDILWTREIHCMANTSFGEQKDEIEKRLRSPNIIKCAIDKGSIGYQLAEELEQKFQGTVESVQLTPGVGGRIAMRMAIAFERRAVRIPCDPILRNDLRSVRKPRTLGGVDRIESETTSEGHADRFWAGALGLEAATVSAVPAASLPTSRTTKARGR